MKKVVLNILGGVVILATGVFIGAKLPCKQEEKSEFLNVTESLQNARENLLANLGDNKTFRSNAELTTLSQFINQITRQEIYWLELKIWNTPNYGKFEKEYHKIREDWEKYYKEEMDKPTGYEGGSANPGFVLAREYELITLYKKQLIDLFERMKNYKD